MSPFQHLEAVVHAIENNQDRLNASTELKLSKRLWDTAATYLIDESPVGASSQEVEPPRAGGLIVPAFGNKYFSIATKATTKGSAKRKSVANQGPPNRGRKRFFASTFAERNKREEKRFFDVIGKKSPQTTQKRKRRSGGERQPRKSTSKVKATSELSRLEEPGDGNVKNVSTSLPQCCVRSRPALRQAAAIARSRILEASADDVEMFSPICAAYGKFSEAEVAASTVIPKTIAVMTPNLDASRCSTRGLFEPTPNTSGIFDFTLSEDDELLKGLPRHRRTDGLATKTANTMLKNVASVLTAPSGDYSPWQPTVPGNFLADMSQCIGVVFSTLNLTELEFSKRLNQLRDQVERMQRLLSHSTGDKEAQNRVKF